MGQLLRKSLKAEFLAIISQSRALLIPSKAIINKYNFLRCEGHFNFNSRPRTILATVDPDYLTSAGACKPLALLLSDPSDSHRPSSVSFLHVHAALTQPPVVPLLPKPFQTTFGIHTSTLRNASFGQERWLSR